MTYNGDYKLGLAVMNRPESVSEQIRLFKKVGWDGIFTGWNREMTAEWAKVAREEGMEYQSIHSPYIGVNNLWLGNEEGDRLCASLIECVRDCARHSIPVMVIHPYIGFQFDQYVPTSAGLERFGKIIAEAERLGVRLGFENVEGEPFLDAIMKTFRDSRALGF
jgi:endonuclease IV